MLKELLKYMQEGKMVSIYTNKADTDKFAVLKIIAADEEGLLGYCISPEGRYDGYLWGKTKDIYRISADGDYEQKMEKLSVINALKESEFTSFDKNISLLKNLLNFAMQKGLIISIEFLDSGYHDVTGFVKKVTANTCTLEEVDRHAHFTGKSIIRIDAITSISCDEEKEQTLRKLIQYDAMQSKKS